MKTPQPDKDPTPKQTQDRVLQMLPCLIAIYAVVGLVFGLFLICAFNEPIKGVDESPACIPSTPDVYSYIWCNDEYNRQMHKNR